MANARSRPLSDRAPLVIVTRDLSVSELYSLRLDDEYDVRTAYDSEEAFERVDDASVVLVDRWLPDRSGSELVSALREQGVSCRAGMISRVEPEIDVVERGFDACLVTPVTEEELNETVETLLKRLEYEELLEEVTVLQSELVALERGRADEELAGDEEYRELAAEVDRLRSRLDEVVAELERADFDAALRSLSRDGGEDGTGSDR